MRRAEKRDIPGSVFMSVYACTLWHWPTLVWHQLTIYLFWYVLSWHDKGPNHKIRRIARYRSHTPRRGTSSRLCSSRRQSLCGEHDLLSWPELPEPRSWGPVARASGYWRLCEGVYYHPWLECENENTYVLHKTLQRRSRSHEILSHQKRVWAFLLVFFFQIYL